MTYALIIILALAVIFLGFKRFGEYQESEETKRELEAENFELEEENKRLVDKLQYTQTAITLAETAYEETLNNRNKELVEKSQQLVNDFNQKQEELKNKLAKEEEEYSLKEKELKQVNKEILNLREAYENLIQTNKMAEKEAQEKLFYTVQIEEEYRDDISFLLSEVAPKVKHPDILNKLVWQEYVKPKLDETLKRVGIENESGIYKITSLSDGKCYIGKSTNLKKRIQDHFKSVVGISAIADQTIHHQILKEGIHNWTIEKIHSCEKNELGTQEKFYIEFFDSQNWGYNKNAGG